jgi:hypothetical protein
VGSGNLPKACEKTGKNRQKRRAACCPVLPKSPRQATFVIRQSMIPKWGTRFRTTGMLKTKISALIRLSRSGSESDRVQGF